MRRRKNNNWKYFMILLVLLVVVSVIPVAMYKSFLVSPAASKEKAIQVSIKKGMSSDTIIEELSQSGLLKSKLMAKLYLKLSGRGDRFKAGTYGLNRNMTPLQIFDILEKRQVTNSNRFVIPEGYNVKQIAEKMVQAGLIQDTEELYKCLRQEKFEFKFLEKLPKGRLYTYEGYLFPDTYEFEKGMTVKHMVNEMLGRFNLVYSRLKDKFAKNDRSLDDIVIVASMVEKESMIDQDRTKISSVIYNRLNIKMRLQIDATVQYALKEHKAKLLLGDLKVDSPYNTYRFKGLPEGPISNPGQKSIEAALTPEKTDYIYYIAKNDGTGGHFFTNSYKEFLRIKNAQK